ncbi:MULTISPECIES: undecaprenyl-diphosphate phosphatase [unclassified Siphonobacter]|uniref:undecaprenyl-diphosphate phosphatase n=1 Tax=unclassified Siphonobacter TaxID=2635712 RepID=UPI000CCB721C|nr:MULTISPECIES: undecaprenyl-diphosphate phosphatase [unclassified Siphonobacter]MDQ1088748.1 undecaprenyl-diphosphatase [Siphonobacter sp. SORGH_AS_1065]MDR6194893.1 undecaprenyl-diphosphatase [Siphonobacter sp. SORGH_AS_0500]PKK38518.1 undecaprenyl-diphosphatase [Siphonobacter sp. SORGH_AS_0500]
MSILHAIILAIIEGLTEYLPISSTGHMILYSSFAGIASDPFVKLFTVAIQFGAILSVVVLYFKRFFRSFNFYIKLFVAFIPAAVFGLLFSDIIDSLLESAMGVAVSLLIGGIILLFVDKWFTNPVITEEKDINLWNAFKIGMFQCIAMIPGVSRSGASIVGGMSQGISRKAAAEFSFFLAVPTMFAATGKKMLDYFMDGNTLTGDQIQLFVIGNVVAFIVAMIAIRFFISFLTKYGFKVFGWYRIVMGIIIIALLMSGVNMEVV